MTEEVQRWVPIASGTNLDWSPRPSKKAAIVAGEVRRRVPIASGTNLDWPSHPMAAVTVIGHPENEFHSFEAMSSTHENEFHGMSPGPQFHSPSMAPSAGLMSSPFFLDGRDSPLQNAASHTTASSLLQLMASPVLSVPTWVSSMASRAWSNPLLKDDTSFDDETKNRVQDATILVDEDKAAKTPQCLHKMAVCLAEEPKRQVVEEEGRSRQVEEEERERKRQVVQEEGRSRQVEEEERERKRQVVEEEGRERKRQVVFREDARRQRATDTKNARSIARIANGLCGCHGYTICPDQRHLYFSTGHDKYTSSAM
jgi:hypothetical protein